MKIRRTYSGKKKRQNTTPAATLKHHNNTPLLISVMGKSHRNIIASRTGIAHEWSWRGGFKWSNRKNNKM